MEAKGAVPCWVIALLTFERGNVGGSVLWGLALKVELGAALDENKRLFWERDCLILAKGFNDCKGAFVEAVVVDDCRSLERRTDLVLEKMDLLRKH